GNSRAREQSSPLAFCLEERNGYLHPPGSSRRQRIWTRSFMPFYRILLGRPWTSQSKVMSCTSFHTLLFLLPPTSVNSLSPTSAACRQGWWSSPPNLWR